MADNSQLADLDARYLDIVTHHERDYQQFALENNIYFAPIDEDEIDRLVRQHYVFHKAFHEKLIFPELTDPERILDCGYGTATWASDVAEEFPDCEVIAVDISPHMKPDDQPDNLDLQVDDLNKRFNFPQNHFDLVHSRLVAGGINTNRWRTYMRDMLKVLKPGGWCQMVEIYFMAQSDNGSLTEDHALRKWSLRYLSSMTNKDLRIANRLKGAMQSAGFVDVADRKLVLPTCGWSNDPHLRELGNANRDNVQEFLSSLALYPFTEMLGMNLVETERLVADARRDADNPSLKAYFSINICLGRKPQRRR